MKKHIKLEWVYIAVLVISLILSIVTGVQIAGEVVNVRRNLSEQNMGMNAFVYGKYIDSYLTNRVELLHWEQKYKDISGSVTTPRLDAVLSVAIRTSRTQGLQLIRDGNIYINGKCCTENAKLLREGDIISVRGYGKYRFRQTGVRSKKGRYHIMVQQYI